MAARSHDTPDIQKPHEHVVQALDISFEVLAGSHVQHSGWQNLPELVSGMFVILSYSTPDVQNLNHGMYLQERFALTGARG
jgi:hypothetical protein